ncbi:hypothetical protein ES703_30058 [subsurface metagenome]
MTYQRTTDTVIHENIVNEWTALVQLDTLAHIAFANFCDNFTVEMIESNNFGYFMELEFLISDIKNSYTRFREITSLHHTEQSIREVLTYTDWEEGEITSTRTYANIFSNELTDLSYRNLKSNVFSTFSIYNEDADQTQEISGLPFFVTNLTQIDWHTEVWGPDNVPVQFEILSSSYGEDDYSVENLYEDTYYINLRDRFSLYHDYQKDLSDNVVGSTLFNVQGIFITPSDGKVYYTSDKLYYKSPNHELAKTDGHYLFIDSDKNGFYETVYVLLPDEDGDCMM